MPSDTPLPGKCGAQLRGKPGQYCIRPQMPNGRCKDHGGKSIPPGPDNPNWKTGEHSKVGVKATLRRLSESLGEGRLDDLREPIHALRAATALHAELAIESDSIAYRTKSIEILMNAREQMKDPGTTNRLLSHLEEGLEKVHAVKELAATADKWSKSVQGGWTLRMRAERALAPEQLEAWIASVQAVLVEELGHDEELFGKVMARIRSEALLGGDLLTLDDPMGGAREVVAEEG